MSKLLYLESSPRKSRSSSIALAKVFLDAYKKNHPQDQILIKDLWKMDLPPFDGDVIDAKYAILHSRPHTEDQKQAWSQVEELIAEFKSADKYLISLPMWNFGIPYRLKHYIDLLVQPGYAFEMTKEGGYNGLIKNKKALLIYSRGGAYKEPAAQKLDLQKAYMENILAFIGFEDIDSIIIEPTLQGEEIKEASVKAAREKAVQKAATF